jgi:transcriptional regulator with XRE-family HTH domain
MTGKKLSQKQHKQSLLTLEIVFGQVIRDHRKRKGLTQIDLEGEDRMERSYISRIERGQVQVCLRGIVHLAERLEMTPAELMDEVMNTYNSESTKITSR